MLSVGSTAEFLSEGEAPRLSLGLLRRDLLQDPHWRVLLPEARALDDRGAPPDCVAALTGSPDVAAAKALATRHGIPCVLLQGGVLRAPPFAARSPSLSLMAAAVVGPAARSPLKPPELLLADGAWATPALLDRARAARTALVARRVGGTWWAPGPESALPDPAIVVALGRHFDHPQGHHPGGACTCLEQLLDRALAHHAAADIVVLADEVETRRLADRARALGVRLLSATVNPWPLIDVARRVYTTDHELGFLALLAGRTVDCATDAYYSGWGATDDAPTVAPRGIERSVETIAAASCLLATRYADPFTGRRCEFEDTLELLAEWRRVNDANRRLGVCVGMSFWKRGRVGEFLAADGRAPAFARRRDAAVRIAARRGAGIGVWASREPAGLRDAAARAGVPVATVEDGFLRSVGLGADFMPAASLVIDEAGIYYDPTRPSGLETILRETTFDAALTERARRLIQVLVARGITKYNIGSGAVPDLAARPGARRILVPGQVEDDRSVLLGGAGVAGNLDLLRRVRAANPDAVIVYKPHPDVDAGHRRGAVPDDAAGALADRVVRDVSSAALLAVVDEVHTMTSLVGFEALLRDRNVTVYGQPFYAGWGLTEDISPPPRRGRRLTLEELVAGALILYPRYLDPVTRLPCGPEVIIDRLSDPSLWRAGPLVSARRLQGLAAQRLKRWSANLFARRPAL